MFLYWINRNNSGSGSKKRIRIAGASEPQISDFPFLLSIELGGMICLQEEANSLELATLLELPYLHSPIVDFSVPTEEALERIIEFCLECQENNPALPILVHCTGGHGRTGTVLAALLIVLDQVNPDDAIKRVREVNPHAIETKDQEALIRSLGTV